MVYTVEQLAKRWQCSKDVIYDMAKEEKIQSFRVGRTLRFSEEAVTEYENKK